MKYCGTCGKELMDETVRCPECKAHQGGKKSNGVSRGIALNFIALLINLVMTAFLFLCNLNTDSNAYLIPIFASAALFVFVLGVLAAHFVQNYSNKMLAYVYIIISLGMVGFLIWSVSNLMAVLFCFIGIIFFVPSILQIKAGISFISSCG